MKLSKQYQLEHKPGGEMTCSIHPFRKTHTELCAFCVGRLLKEKGVKEQTLRLASAVFRTENAERAKQAIAAIDKELEK